jgi:hypothetical protein
MSSKSYILSGSDLNLDLEQAAVDFEVRTLLIGTSKPPPGAAFTSNLVWRVQGSASKATWSRTIVTTPGVQVPIAVGHLERFTVTLLRDPAPFQGLVTLLEDELVYSAGRQLWPQDLPIGESPVPAGATTAHIVTAGVNLIFRSNDAAGTAYDFTTGATTAGQTLNVRGTRIVVSVACRVLWEIGL